MFSQKKVRSVTLFRPNGPAVYEVGQNLVINDKPTDIRVDEVNVKNETVIIFFSNGEVLEFHSVPFAIAK